jgi:putative oxidoreductase
METALWVVQALVALAFAFHGYQLAFALEKMRGRVVWPRDVSDQLLRPIGILEILAAFGLILPTLTRVLPWLTVLAAACLVVLMVLAIVFHVRRGEWRNIVLNSIFLVLAAFIAYGRWVIVPV